jgi:hypothetical protein
MLEKNGTKSSFSSNLALAGAFARIDTSPRFSSPNLSCGYRKLHDDSGFDDTHDNYADGDDPHDDAFN